MYKRQIYDGSGGEPYAGDIGIKGDRIVYAGPSRAATATKTVDAQGLAVAPGFINMLSWATESLLVDGLGQSDLRQGVTLEVMGEGESAGPLNRRMKKELRTNGRPTKHVSQGAKVGRSVAEVGDG